MAKYKLGQSVLVYYDGKWKNGVVCAIIKNKNSNEYLVYSKAKSLTNISRFKSFFSLFNSEITSGKVVILQDCDVWKGNSFGWSHENWVKPAIENIE